MLVRLVIFKIVFAFLVLVSAFGLAIRESVNESLSGSRAKTTAVNAFRRYPLPLGCACAAVAGLAAFGDLLLFGRRKGTLPTYTDEEFIAKFGGSPDGQRTLQ
jgi:hypothetical protein